MELPIPEPKSQIRDTSTCSRVDDLPELPDLVFGEIFRALAGHRNVLAMLVVIGVSEAIELGLVHVRDPGSVNDAGPPSGCARGPVLLRDATFR